MVILITGSEGFIGAALVRHLQGKGHTIVRCVHAPAKLGTDSIVVDFSRNEEKDGWPSRLAGIDVVVNTVGIFRERGCLDFENIHVAGPAALFNACAAAGVKKIIHFSALGADGDAASKFHRSKKEGDDFLRSLPIASCILQPSLVYGPGGASAQLFNALASLPIVPKLGARSQMIQPVHLDDVVDAAAKAAMTLHAGSRTIALVGPEKMSFESYLHRLRTGLEMAPAGVLQIPKVLVIGGLALAALMRLPVDRQAFAMLERGNIADSDPIARLLGRPPRPVENFVPPGQAAMFRASAILTWLLPILRWSLATVWIVSGLVSAFSFPIDASYELLARVGLPAPLRSVGVYGGAAVDIVLGVSILLLQDRTWAWRLQLVLVAFYTLIIAWKLPEFTRHPFGPLIKNLPILAATWLLLQSDRP
ncbi:MAG: short chain dehydrogenase [Bradyrhizobium sp.]|nr:short chain dehydrogenase [Bradyrhizobium sp.]